MKIVIFVWENPSNSRQSSTTDGTGDMIINIYFIIISNNIQTNQSCVNLIFDFNLSTTNRKQYGQQEFMKEKLPVKI